jgi:hypothetical protein
MNIREKVSINYVMVKNGGELDTSLIEELSSMNMK